MLLSRHLSKLHTNTKTIDMKKAWLYEWLLVVALVAFVPALHAQNVRSRYNSSYTRSAARTLNRDIPTRSAVYTERILVSGQADFDAFPGKIRDAVKRGHKQVEVTFTPGIYYFSEKHLVLSKMDNVAIRINGNGAMLVGKGGRIGASDVLEHQKTYLDAHTRQVVDLWSEMQWCDGKVEVLNKETKSCRLKMKDPDVLKRQKPTYIHLTQSYGSSIYKIDRIQGNYIYFTAGDLKEVGEDYSVNRDLIDGTTDPRFKFFPVRITGKDIYACGAANFLTVNNSTFQELKIGGLVFLGNKGGDYLIRMTKASGNGIVISDCEFAGINAGVAYLDNADDVTFAGNYFHDNYYYGVSSNNTSSNTRILNNRFENNCFSLKHSFCVKCVGSDFLVAGNVFKNFCYGAVKIGYDYNLEMKSPSSGIVEYNEIFCDEEYNRNPWKYTVMDGGAIYTATQSAGNIIRYNFIHDIPGMRSNRGIFLDDGSFGEAVYGNIVVGIANSHCIDSRRVASIEASRRSNSKVQRANVDNLIMYNILDGSLRFFGREGEGKGNGCIKGMNYVLTGGPKDVPAPRRGNIDAWEEDVNLSYAGWTEGSVYLSASDCRKLKKSPVWKHIQQFIKEK